ncbi:MAG TPA: MltA-interacting MipA family protein, partial [Desulfobacterales bacterium]|nr:MltA-interacting MipA family protein [Desulfobacterales bacterium]
MKKHINLLLASSLVCGALAAAPALAAEDAPTAEVAVDALSEYVWRGYSFSQDSIVLQPSMTVAWKGFGVNLWGNLDTDE